MMAAVCKDGIVIAADSRGNFYNKNEPIKKSFAYFDNSQKIFRIGNIVLTHSGNGVIGGALFSSFIREFKKELILPMKLNDIYGAFFRFIERIYPTVLDQIQSQHYIAVGYEGDKPFIFYYDPNRKIKSGFADKFVQSRITKLTNNINQLDSLSFQETAMIMRQSIADYVYESKEWDKIGGLVSIALVTSDSVRWVENKPLRRRWTST